MNSVESKGLTKKERKKEVISNVLSFEKDAKVLTVHMNNTVHHFCYNNCRSPILNTYWRTVMIMKDREVDSMSPVDYD